MTPKQAHTAQAALDLKAATARLKEGPATWGQISTAIGKPTHYHWTQGTQYDDRPGDVINALKAKGTIKPAGWFGGHAAYALASA